VADDTVQIPFFKGDAKTLIPLPRQALEPYDVTVLAGFSVDESYAAPDAIKFAIPLGSHVLVHMDYHPVHGEWSLAYAETLKLHILYKHEENRKLFLRRYYDNEPIALADMREVRILGPLVSHYVPAPRLAHLRT
jgi:hypothetical protein